MVSRARNVLVEVTHLVEAARAHDQPLTGRIRLGMIPTVAPYLLPNVLSRARDRYSELTLQLHEAQTADLLTLLHQGELDLLLLALEADLNGVKTAPLFRDPFVLAAPSSHRLAERKGVTDGDFADEPILLLEDGHCLRHQALSFCHQAGAPELSDFRASSLPTLLQMVAGGSGITLLPTIALPVEARDDHLAVIPFRKPAPYWTIGLAWQPTSPRTDEYNLLGQLLKP